MAIPFKIHVTTVEGENINIDIAPGKKEFIRLKGGMLIISELDNFIPPIGCTKSNCDELAEYFVGGVSSRGKESDTMCWLCKSHLDELLKYNDVNSSYEIVH